MNIARLREDALVLDPMCGSGTTLVEARVSGRSSIGMDMNPLSVFITKVKCEALGFEPKSLINAYTQLERLVCQTNGYCKTSGRLAEMPPKDRDYLERWFAQQTIIELSEIDEAISKLSFGRTVKDFFRLTLSNILRKVSLQKADDLRIRREVKEFSVGKVRYTFLQETARSVVTVSAFLAEYGSRKLGPYSIVESDARKACSVLPHLIGTVDAVITSPPYATALPYIDTDRLSLSYLQLLPREEHRARDAVMIGNREISPRDRARHWAYYEDQRVLLPNKTRAIIEEIHDLNGSESVGFRRKNMAALLAKYFFDMRETMQQMFGLLRAKGSMFVVVGSNRTTAGQKEIDINTPDHLAAIAENVGFRLQGNIPMEMLVSRDIFRKNAIAAERILELVKPQ